MTTALVHPSTAHLPPEDQAKGVYVTLTPEQQHAAMLAGQPAEGNHPPQAGEAPRRLVMPQQRTPVGLRDAVLAVVFCLPTDAQHSLLKSLAAKHGYEME